MPVQYDSKVIKPFSTYEWTNEMVEEYVKCAKSVKYFVINHCRVPHPMRGIIKPDLRDYQMRMLDSINNNQKNIICVGRQIGKCQVYDTKIKVRNKKTGEQIEVAIGEFLEKYLTD
jgi:hypothetical protein